MDKTEENDTKEADTDSDISVSEKYVNVFPINSTQVEKLLTDAIYDVYMSRDIHGIANKELVKGYSENFKKYFEEGRLREDAYDYMTITLESMLNCNLSYDGNNMLYTGLDRLRSSDKSIIHIELIKLLDDLDILSDNREIVLFEKEILNAVFIKTVGSIINDDSDNNCCSNSSNIKSAAGEFCPEQSSEVELSEEEEKLLTVTANGEFNYYSSTSKQISDIISNLYYDKKQDLLMAEISSVEKVRNLLADKKISQYEYQDAIHAIKRIVLGEPYSDIFEKILENGLRSIRYSTNDDQDHVWKVLIKEIKIAVYTDLISRVEEVILSALFTKAFEEQVAKRSIRSCSNSCEVYGMDD